MNDVSATGSVSMPQPFESASELRQQHSLLLEALDKAMLHASQAEAPDAAAMQNDPEAEALRHVEPEIVSFLERAARTGIYLEDVKERTACQTVLDYWVSSLAQASVQAPATRLAPFDGAQLPDLEDKPCPYVGLEAFRDRNFFFGRDADCKAVIDQLDTSPLLVVLGASGSGKSSLIMGGVLPRLRASNGETAWCIAPVFVPGNAVLTRLTQTVLQCAGDPPAADDIARELLTRPDALIEHIGRERAPILITIDQFEEVFTLCDQTTRDAAVATIAALLADSAGHRVIITMREEFRTRLVELQPLVPYLDKAWYSMRPMGYSELRAAVERPAAIVNLQFQTGIIDDLVKKVLGQPAALPLLQFTLRELWNWRDRNRITWEVYRKVGDPLVALKSSADAFYDRLAPQTQIEVRRILLELVRVDDLLEAYRQPVPKSTLTRAGKADTEDVLALLAKNDWVRITAGEAAADPIVEVKHEALIRNWPRLVGWIDEKRVERRQRLALTQAAQRWAASNRPPVGLLTGWQLEEAERLADLSGVEREFVQKSAAELERLRLEREALFQRETNRLRRWRFALSAALVIAVGALFVAYREYERAKDLSRTLKSRELAGFAIQRAENDPEVGLLLALRAYETWATSQAVGALQHAMGRGNAVYVKRSAGGPASPSDAVLAPDGREILTILSGPEQRSIVEAIDTESDQTRVILEVPARLEPAMFSPGGHFFYGGSEENSSFSIWETRNGRQLAGPDTVPVFRAMTFVADATAIATDAKGRLLIWRPDHPIVELKGGFPGLTERTVLSGVRSGNDGQLTFSRQSLGVSSWSTYSRLRGGEGHRSRPSVRNLVDVQLSADGTRILMTDPQAGAIAWNTGSGERIATVPGGDGNLIAADRDARHVALHNGDDVRLWRLDQGGARQIGKLARVELPDQPSKIIAVRVLGGSPLRLLVATLLEVGDERQKLFVWTPGKEKASAVEHSMRDVNRYAASGDGRFVATLSGLSVMVTDLASGGRKASTISADDLDARLAFTPDSRWLVLSPPAGRLTLVDPVSGAVVSTFRGHAQPITRTIPSKDGTRLLSADGAGELRLWHLPRAARALQLKSPSGKPWDDGPENAMFSPEGNSLIVSFPSEGMAAFDRDKQTWRAQPMPDNAAVGSFFASADGRHLLTIDSDDRARIWSVDGPRLLAALTPPSRQPVQDRPSRSRIRDPGAFKVGGISNDGTVAWTWNEAEEVTVWRVATAEPQFTISNIKGEEKKCVTMSPDARWLAICIAGKRFVRVYDLASQNEHVDLVLDADAEDVFFSADGRYSITTAENLTGIVHRTDSWKPVSKMRLRGALTLTQFSADGRFLLTVDQADTVRTFEVATGRLLAEVRHDDDVVTAADLGPGGSTFAIGTAGGALDVWDTKTGKRLASQSDSSTVSAVRFEAASQEIAVLRADGTLTTIDCEMCVKESPLIEMAKRKLARLKPPLTDEDKRSYHLD